MDKCQSSDVTHIHVEDGTIRVDGTEARLLYAPRLLTLTGVDGTVHTVAHESRAGDQTFASVWSSDLGDCYVEAMHPGTGPEGGEIVIVVPSENQVFVGDLMGPGDATAAWATAVDLTIGLMSADTVVQTSSATVTRDDLDRFHQELLGRLHG